MATKATARRSTASHPIYLNEGLSSKKTALIIVTVIGCIAILWPKVFYPMMFGGTTPKAALKEQRGPGGCCDVVLDREKFLNATPLEIGPQVYRKQLNLLTGEMSLRQERPAHLHPESIYQAMRERGRAIPITPTIPIVERKGSASNPPPRIVEGRPGPIPGMRPPMGAGSMHQPQAKGTSMGFIMPLYTIGIVVFFGYTIMKIVFKKPVPNAPYGPAPTDPNFRREVFGQQENGRHVEDINGSKIGNATNTHTQDHKKASELYNATLSAATVASNLSSSLKQHQQQHHPKSYDCQQQKLQETATQLLNKETDQLMEIEKLKKKLEETERAMAKLIADLNTDRNEAKKFTENATTNNGDISNEHTNDTEHETNSQQISSDAIEATLDKTEVTSSTAIPSHENIEGKDLQQQKRREGSVERSVAVLGMEMTASCEGGRKWTGRPPTPVFFAHNEHSKSHEEDMPEPQSIYLEGALAHDSQILIADAQTKREEVFDAELNGSPEEPAVVLSSKMTLSLINLDQQNDLEQQHKQNSLESPESPLADDIEIIGHDEK